MSEEQVISPALQAAREADNRVASCVQENKHFLLEAGAGAGKTYSLVETLRHLIATRGSHLRRLNQRIACITYTNAATAVINSRIDGNPVVFTDTIHAFCWSLIKGFQSDLRRHVSVAAEWQERLTETGGLGTRRIEYDLGHRRITSDAVSLHHDDVLLLTVALMQSVKFRTILAAKYPYVLIDEYQDTNQTVMASIKEHLISRPNGPLVGLFGDHWQRIYDDTCGHVSDPALNEIGKGANFRSATAIVNVLNKMRPSLPQAFKDQTFVGSAMAYHTNSWTGERRTGAGGGHWKGDLPATVAHQYLDAFIAKLKKEGWDFAPDMTKVLMLTHSALASEQGYSALSKVFPYTDLFIKKEDDYIAFFADKLEPAVDAYQRRRFGEMFALLGDTAPRLRSHADKVAWSTAIEAIVTLRATGTVGQVIDQIRNHSGLHLSDAIMRREEEASKWQDEAGVEIPDKITRSRQLRNIPYSEVIALTQFIEGHTPFATKHSVKGDEFENVVVVLGRGWNKYNFEQFLEWSGAAGCPVGKSETFERYRNLFYVACSRPTTRLALLFTQQLSAAATQTLMSWFGPNAVQDFAP